VSCEESTGQYAVDDPRSACKQLQGFRAGAVSQLACRRLVCAKVAVVVACLVL
jgi:hypothetical protein